MLRGSGRRLKETTSRQGGLIRSGRLAREMSQQAIAENLGVSTQFISHLESGVTPIPKRFLTQIGSLLGIEQDTLINSIVEDYRDELSNS